MTAATDAGAGDATVREPEGLYEKYMLYHPADVRGCLRQLIDKRCVVSVHAAGTDRAVTAVLGLDEASMWIDIPRDAALTEQLLAAERLRFETAIDRITVRFTTGPAQRGLHADLPALEVPLPIKVMHLQRREYVRREPIGALRCQLPVHDPAGTARRVRATIADIGGGGLAVLTADDTALDLVAGELIPDIVLDLPEQGPMTVTLRVQHASRIEQQGQRVWRAGCSFVGLTVQDQARLLRYVMQLDRLHAARLRNQD